jgi:transposase
LTDPGCDFSVLSEFRSRVLKGGLEEIFLTTLLSVCRERGWLKERGKQRTDSTHIEAAIRTMNRIECAGETLRAALNSLAVVVPDWLRAHTPQAWHDRYALRIQDFRMPREATKLQALVEQIGQDGWEVLNWIWETDAPSWLRDIPAVEILRRVWLQQFWMEEGRIRWRSNDNIPPSSLLIASPYDVHAHLNIKRGIVWTGYKAHLTETCDDLAPHLIIHVETTSATTQDMEMTSVIHQKLEQKRLLPSEHLMDTGYVDGAHLVTNQRTYGVELIGPVAVNGSWQSKSPEGLDNTQFLIDWEKKIVTCPQGKTSKKWTVKQDKTVSNAIRAQFSKKDCLACPVRSQCTRAAVNPRQIVFRQQEHHEAIQAARKRQTTREFKERYAKRSGIEGTISQGVRAFGLRTSRYLGTEKTHLQHVLIATAMNVARLFQWQMGQTPSQRPISRFASLAL